MLTANTYDIHTTIATFNMMQSTLTAVTLNVNSQTPINTKHPCWCIWCLPSPLTTNACVYAFLTFYQLLQMICISQQLHAPWGEANSELSLWVPTVKQPFMLSNSLVHLRPSIIPHNRHWCTHIHIALFFWTLNTFWFYTNIILRINCIIF